MRQVGMTAAVCVALVCGAWAAGSWYRAEQLRTEADWLLERGKAQASGYAQSFDDRLASQELETFARRRGVMEQAFLWQRAQMLGVLFAAVAAAIAWVLGLLHRLQASLDEASEEREDEESGPRPVPVRVPIPRSHP